MIPFPLPVSQRIAAADLAPGLQYFGRSIHGTMDMNDDGLVDLAVGSLGAAVLLWLVFHPVNNTVNMVVVVISAQVQGWLNSNHIL